MRIEDTTGKQGVPTSEHTLIFDGVECTLDLTDDSAAALKALATQDGTAPGLLRALYLITEATEPPASADLTEAPQDNTVPELPQGDTVPDAPGVVFTPPVANEVDPAAVRAWGKTNPKWRSRVKDHGVLSPLLIADYVAAQNAQS